MQIYLDLDGPILDVSRRYYAIYSDLLNRAGYRPLDQASYWSLKRLSFQESAIVGHSCPSGFVEDYLVERQNLIEDPAYLSLDNPHSGVLQHLENWRETHELTLVTLRRNYQSLVSQLDFVGIRRLLADVLVGSIGCPGWRAKKERIETSLRDANNALVIGDTETDVLAAHALELPSVAVTCGIRTRRLLAHLAPNLLVRDLGELHIDRWPVVCHGSELRSRLLNAALTI